MTEPIHPFAKRTESRSFLADGTLGAIVYMSGQAFNFGFQLLLLNALGGETYGRVGLAHLTLITLIFIGDLGYGLYFLREKIDTKTWRWQWRLAYGHRLVLVSILVISTLGFWSISYGLEDTGFLYLVAAAPAVFFSLFNYSSPMISAGKKFTGFLLQQIVWPISTLVLVIAILTGESASDSLVFISGLAISIGYFFQAVVNITLLRFKGILLPIFSREGLPILAISIRLSFLGVVGSLHDRLTPFLMEQVSIDYLPLYIVLIQALAGASGVMSQLYRLLVSREFAGGNSITPVLTLISALIFTGSLVFSSMGIACSDGCGTFRPEWARLTFVVFLSWIIQTIGGLIGALLIGRSKEAELARAILIGVILSVILQYFAMLELSAVNVLWGRLIGIAVAVGITFRLSKLQMNWKLLALSIIIFLYTNQPDSYIQVEYFAGVSFLIAVIELRALLIIFNVERHAPY